MQPIILFRDHIDHKEEFTAAKKYFQVNTQRNACRHYSKVIGRYSVLPYYQELEIDLQWNGCQLINTYDQHKYIANFEYYRDIIDLTFQTWTYLPWVPDEAFPIVIKGCTNSRKHKWNTQMFAKDRRTAAEISHELLDDQLIGPQGLIYRKYEPLRVFEEGINGLNFTNEWRTFVLNGEIVASGFYWSQIDEIPAEDMFTSEAKQLVEEVIKRVADKVPFFVVDVGQREDGSWVVIELNDGQCSGLSLIEPDLFYKRLWEILNGKKEMAKDVFGESPVKIGQRYFQIEQGTVKMLERSK